jgi:predicted 3-demethylubiquinone-9 3-methyltransferase (glyoxalase superfamily)
MTVDFELEGLRFTALNGGPVFEHSPAISFFVTCDSQAEVDRYWEKLVAGGQESRCGWLVDKFGVSWQVIPARLPELVKNERAMKAMLGMQKIDLAALEAAAAKPQRKSRK